jgi:hypothetical protein
MLSRIATNFTEYYVKVHFTPGYGDVYGVKREFS